MHQEGKGHDALSFLIAPWRWA